MKNLTLLFMMLIITSCVSLKKEENQMLNSIAESYVSLVLETGPYIEYYIDFYYGPENLKPLEPDSSMMSNPPFELLLSKADSLLAKLDDCNKVEFSKDEKMRFKFLHAHLIAVKTKIEMELGAKFPFDIEYKKLFDASAPTYDTLYLRNLITELDSILEGEGDIVNRYYRFLSKFYLPTDKMEEIYQTTLNEAKLRTNKYLKLHANDSCSLEFVTDKPWDAFNAYKQNGQSIVQVNTNYRKQIKTASDIACHEAYPGHHIHSSMWEEHLYQGKGWVEFSIGAIYTPSYIIYEGIAEFARDVAFPNEEWIKFEKEVLFPIAGLDTREIRLYEEVRGIYKKIQWGSIIEGSRQYLDGNYSKEEAIDYFMTYTLRTRDEAESILTTIEYYRTYLVNYLNGLSIIENFVESNGGTIDNIEKRWELVYEIMTNPYLPSDLQKN